MGETVVVASGILDSITYDGQPVRWEITVEKCENGLDILTEQGAKNRIQLFRLVKDRKLDYWRCGDHWHVGELFHYFSKRLENEYPHDVFEHGPTHLKHRDRPYSLCGVHAYTGGGSSTTKFENKNDEMVTCISCRRMLGLSDA